MVGSQLERGGGHGGGGDGGAPPAARPRLTPTLLAPSRGRAATGSAPAELPARQRPGRELPLPGSRGSGRVGPWRERGRSMESPAVTFTLAYLVFAVCFVFPPDEVRSAGLTVQSLLAAWLGSEDAAFVQYHLRRSTGTLLAHSLLPLGEPRPAAGREGLGKGWGGVPTGESPRGRWGLGGGGGGAAFSLAGVKGQGRCRGDPGAGGSKGVPHSCPWVG